jgi:hypothetical protein
MGVTTSSAAPRGQTEITHGIFLDAKYHWTPGQIAQNIQQGIVTPTHPPSVDRTPSADCMCLICYHFFPTINEMKCCQHAICTECLACIVKPPPEPRICPFCKVENFTISPNFGARQLSHFETGEVETPLAIDDSKPDDFNALMLQFPTIDTEIAWVMYQAGISVEEIAAEMGQSV